MIDRGFSRAGDYPGDVEDGAMMQRVDEMREPPVVGQFYLVPTIFYRFGESRKAFDAPKARHWPVMGTRHEDAEHIGFLEQHYHMDWRFATAAAVRYAERRAVFLGIGEQAIYGLPLSRTGEEHGAVTHRRMKCQRVPPVIHKPVERYALRVRAVCGRRGSPP